jgi:phosphonate transport system ATP-binding protein
VDVAPARTVPAVLEQVSLVLARGECVALVGPSGSGKTTLLRTIATLIPPAAGHIEINGIDPASLRREELRRLRRKIGMIAQRGDLVESLRVHQNVMAGALGRWSNWRALRFLVRPVESELAEAREALAAVGLEHKLRGRTDQLSGGEQQRVAIARALVQDPSLLLADEPVASLDRANAEDVLSLLTSLARTRGMGLIMSLHQPDLAEKYCDSIFMLGSGQVEQSGSPG